MEDVEPVQDELAFYEAGHGVGGQEAGPREDGLDGFNVLVGGVDDEGGQRLGKLRDYGFIDEGGEVLLVHNFPPRSDEVDDAFVPDLPSPCQARHDLLPDDGKGVREVRVLKPREHKVVRRVRAFLRVPLVGEVAADAREDARVEDRLVSVRIGGEGVLEGVVELNGEEQRERVRVAKKNVSRIVFPAHLLNGLGGCDVPEGHLPLYSREHEFIEELLQVARR